MLTNTFLEGYSIDYLDKGITSTKFQSFLDTQYLKLYLNLAIAYSKTDSRKLAEDYLKKAVEYLQAHPQENIENPGISARINYFAKNGLPFSENMDDGALQFRVLKDKIEESFDKVMKGNFSEYELAEIEQKIEQLKEIPEASFLMSYHTMAKYYHSLFMLYSSLNNQVKSVKNLKKAEEMCKQDKEVYNLYGEIYCDMGTNCSDLFESIRLFDKAKKIFEELESSEKGYSQNSFAILLNNYAIVLCKIGRYTEAYKCILKAEFLWKSLYELSTKPQLAEYIKRTEGLKRYIVSLM